jgi:hypothetical protein
VGRDSVVVIVATSWTVRVLNPGGGEICSRPDRPWGPPSLLYTGYRVIRGLKRRVVNHSPSSGAEAKERVELYLYSPSGLLWHITG